MQQKISDNEVLIFQLRQKAESPKYEKTLEKEIKELKKTIRKLNSEFLDLLISHPYLFQKLLF